LDDMTVVGPTDLYRQGWCVVGLPTDKDER
jgi:hypothetical protein